jgi:hypothetical protein
MPIKKRGDICTASYLRRYLIFNPILPGTPALRVTSKPPSTRLSFDLFQYQSGGVDIPERHPPDAGALGTLGDDDANTLKLHSASRYLHFLSKLCLHVVLTTYLGSRSLHALRFSHAYGFRGAGHPLPPRFSCHNTS